MLIETYLKSNPEWDIYEECELEFANSDDAREAKENLEWVLNNEPHLEALQVVVCSYYGGVINWGSM